MAGPLTEPREVAPSESSRLGGSEVIVSPADTFVAVAAAALAAELREPVGDSLSLALSGGSTPGPVYERLAREDLAWSRLKIFFADERAVPPTHEASNYGLIRRTLLELLPEEPRRVFRMEAERAGLEEAAARYDRSLPDALDLLVLGIGDDGHTASLFPGSPHLEVATTRRVAVAESPLPPTPRLTITPVVIRAARQIYVLARGQAKAGPVARALLGSFDISACPAQLARGGTWVLDEEAAALL